MSADLPEAPGGMETYHVVLLVERALTALDAQQVRSLHEGIEEPVARDGDERRRPRRRTP
jgi:hypothetical protein